MASEWYNNSFMLLQTIKDLPDVQDVTDKGSEVDGVPQQWPYLMSE
jgi:hypothetical protein